MTTTQQYADKVLTKIGCMRKIRLYAKKQKTSFACGFTSIERRTIFDLWQMSYAAQLVRMSLC